MERTTRNTRSSKTKRMQGGEEGGEKRRKKGEEQEQQEEVIGEAGGPETSRVSKKKKKVEKTTTKGSTPGRKQKVKTTTTREVVPGVEGEDYVKTGFSLQPLVPPAWGQELKHLFNFNYIKQLEDLLEGEYKRGTEIYPPKHLIFNAFSLTPINKIKVVILGQDPYHGEGQAHGLSFSVPHGVPPPPSLKNIYKELTSDVTGFTAPSHGCLEKWASEGVFLLNAFLTVQAHKAGSHAKYGWQSFTDDVIRHVSDVCDGVVFLLWGKFAQNKERLIDASKHGVLVTAHPSPLSWSKFTGCKCFSEVNKMLATFNKTPIDWSL